MGALTYLDLKSLYCGTATKSLDWLLRQAIKLRSTQRIVISPTELVAVPVTLQEPIRSVHALPKGVWYSFGYTEILYRLQMHLEPLTSVQFVYEVTLSSSVLHLSCPEELDKFTKEFGKMPHFTMWLDRSKAIDWCRVAAQYAGIEIAPYCAANRYLAKTDWYYPWDYARGCLWGPTAVEDLKLLSAFRERT